VKRETTDPAIARFRARVALRDANDRRARTVRTVVLAVGLIAAFGIVLVGGRSIDAQIVFVLGLAASLFVGRRIGPR
jgi:hypothetical protein